MVTVSWRLSEFTGARYDKGRSVAWQASWHVVHNAVFVKWWLPTRLRPAILRAFGARVGHGVLIRDRVRIHWPWKLAVGDACWIGEGAWILNLEPVVIGSNCCISQEALLCTGSHDRTSETFEFDNGPIEIEDSTWIAVRAVVLRGVRIGRGSVVGATALVRSDVPPDSLVLAAHASPPQAKR